MLYEIESDQSVRERPAARFSNSCPSEPLKRSIAMSARQSLDRIAASWYLTLAFVPLDRAVADPSIYLMRVDGDRLVAGPALSPAPIAAPPRPEACYGSIPLDEARSDASMSGGALKASEPEIEPAPIPKLMHEMHLDDYKRAIAAMWKTSPPSSWA